MQGMPDKIKLSNGKILELVVCRVDLWNEDGTPLQVTMGRGQDVFALDEDDTKNRFFTAYVFPINKDDE